MSTHSSPAYLAPYRCLLPGLTAWRQTSPTLYQYHISLRKLQMLRSLFWKLRQYHLPPRMTGHRVLLVLWLLFPLQSCGHLCSLSQTSPCSQYPRLICKVHLPILLTQLFIQLQGSMYLHLPGFLPMHPFRHIFLNLAVHQLLPLVHTLVAAVRPQIFRRIYHVLEMYPLAKRCAIFQC